MKLGVLLVPAVFAVDCMDGNNGGCSHRCNYLSQTCECPNECWTLGDDGLICTPVTDSIQFSCSAAGISLSVDKCVYSGNSVTAGFANSEDCLMTFNEESKIYHVDNVALDACGFSAVTVGDKISFENQVQVFSMQSNVGATGKNAAISIFTSTNLDINVACEFDTQLLDASTDIDIINEDQFFDGTSAQAEFSFNVEFYGDSSFSELLDKRFDMFVGDQMFFAIDTTHELIDGIRYFLDSCTVSATVDGQDYSYAMIENACVSKPNYAQVELYMVDSLALFDQRIGVSYRSFQFVPNAPDTEMEMTCNVRACVEADCPESC